MNKIYLLILLCFTSILFAQNKNCDFEINEVTDTTVTVITKEKMIFENSLLTNKQEFLTAKLYAIDDQFGINFQLIQKSSGLIEPTCLDKNSSLIITLENNEQIQLINSVKEESCNTMNYENTSKLYFRILDGYFSFLPKNFELLKSNKIQSIQLITITGNLEFKLEDELNSSLTQLVSKPKSFFIELLPYFNF